MLARLGHMETSMGIMAEFVRREFGIPNYVVITMAVDLSANKIKNLGRLRISLRLITNTATPAPQTNPLMNFLGC